MNGAVDLADVAIRENDYCNCIAFSFLKDIFTVSGVTTSILARITNIKTKLQANFKDLDRNAALTKLVEIIKKLKQLLVRFLI